ncbi:MAG: D-alanyl-D-alanine endopeptidase [Aeromonas sp.]
MRASALLFSHCAHWAGLALSLASLLVASDARSELPSPRPLRLYSNHALVMEMNTGRVLFAKASNERRPIASITKLMTALIVLDSGLDLDEILTIDERDRDVLKHSRSRIRMGTQITRREALHLALMSSENRMAATLARHYPSGRGAFIQAMNAKAKALGMHASHFVDATGLSPLNISTARDLAKLVTASYRQPLIRQFTQDSNELMQFSQPRYSLQFNNTNPLVRNSEWQVLLSKTGFTNEAGRCLVMWASPEQRALAIVLLDSVGKRTPMGDANRIRQWLNRQP